MKSSKSQIGINPTIIEKSSGWKVIDLKEIINYRDLLYFLVLREHKILYQQTVMGFMWALIRPLFSMVIFSLIFGKLAKLPSDGIPYPVFSYAALVPWTYFSSALTRSTDSLISSVNVFTKVYFPRLLIPLAPVISGLLDFFISISILFFLMAWYGIYPNIHILWSPLLVIIMIMTSAGIGLWLSCLSVQYRDIKHGIQFLAQLLMYAAPVVWPLSLLSEKFEFDIVFWYGFYPMVGVIEGFRSCLIGINPMPWDLIFSGMASSLLIFISGCFYFLKKERIFADVA